MRPWKEGGISQTTGVQQYRQEFSKFRIFLFRRLTAHQYILLYNQYICISEASILHHGIETLDDERPTNAGHNPRVVQK